MTRPNAPPNPLRRLLACAAAAAAVLLAGTLRTPAGCLAPADALIDVSGTVGPFWGNDSGALLYARGVGSEQELVRRGLGEFPEPVAAAGEQNRFQVGTHVETWSAFHGGAMNSKRDCAFIASTTIVDDPATPEDESLARRGAYAFRGNTTFEIGRFGNRSPIPDGGTDFVPWGSFFDAVPLGRGDAGGLRVVYSAQLGAPDGRQGLFLWDETLGTSVPLVLSGDDSPSGGPYTAFGRVRCNQAGDVVFYGITQLTPSSPVAPGLFRIVSSDLHETPVVARVVRFGDAGDTPAGIGRLSLLQDFDVDDAGNVVFEARVDGGAASPSALLRWDAGVVSLVAKEGQATPLGGAYGSFAQQSQVRSDEAGTATFMVPVGGAVTGVGFFSVARGSQTVVPLGLALEPLTMASTGKGRVAYQTATETRNIVPADGTEEGPNDFRVALVDLRNSAAIKKDTLRLDLRLRLAPWGTGPGQAPPAVLLADADRTSPEHRFGPSEFTEVREVDVRVSESPGQVFAFGIGGTPDKPAGYVTVNGASGFVTKFSLAKDRSAASWRYTHPLGAGSFSIDLVRGVAKLQVTKGSFPPSFEPLAFPVELTLRTAADVTANRTGAAAAWFRSVRLDADQPDLRNGRRVLSKGERLGGGTFFVDVLRVDRKLKVKKGQAAPDVSSDTVRLSGTLRLCPGSTPPSTPVLTADVTVGDLVLTALPMKRVGKTGSKYTAKTKVGAVSAALTVDVLRASFSFRAANVPPLSQLADADFSGATDTNSAKASVGGMSLPVTISIDRVYVSASDFAITRLKGGKAFVR